MSRPNLRGWSIVLPKGVLTHAPSSVFASFTTREIRSRFIHARFAAYPKESVLDVGCFNGPLRTLLGPATYVGVDIEGNPDITLDMEKVERLPFNDARGEYPSHAIGISCA